MRLDTYLHDSAQRHPDRLALVCGERRASYGELETAANALAHALRGLGLARQQRVAIQLDNSVEAVQALFGTLKAAGVFVLVNPQVKGDKLAFVLKDCGVRVLVTDARHYAAAAPELSACPELEQVILAGDATAAQPAGCELHHSAGVLALYLWDRSRRRVTVPTLRFWTAAQRAAEIKHRRRLQQ